MNLLNRLKFKFNLWFARKVRSILAMEELITRLDDLRSSRFKSFGEGSKFWGNRHFISGHESFVVGQNVHINNNAYIVADGGLIIGDNTHISRNLVLYTRNHNYLGKVLPYDETFVDKAVTIGSNVWIGMNVIIVPGAQIGDGAIIGMGSVVSGYIPPFSIVVGPKASVVNSRAKEHYDLLDKHMLYAGANGWRYVASDQKDDLIEIGDKVSGLRSVKELFIDNEIRYVKKTFFSTQSGREAFAREIEGYLKFQKYTWCPKVISYGDLYINIEYLDPACRLDKLPGYENGDLLSKVLLAILEMYSNGYTHRDLHVENLFLLKTGEIKICDFETLVEHGYHAEFLNSYDFTGLGFESPYNTLRMNFFSDSPKSLGRYFRISDKEMLREAYAKIFKEMLLSETSNFFTRFQGQSRHQLSKKQIYSSVNLPGFCVSVDQSQRNTSARIKRFGLTSFDLKGKRLVDFGANYGAFLMELNSYEPALSIGLEKDAEKVRLGNLISTYCNLTNITFNVFDIEDSSTSEVYNIKADILFCLAVVGHLRDKTVLFDKIQILNPLVIFFEGNANSNLEEIEAEFVRIGYSNYKFLGYSDDEKNVTNNVRPLWRVAKEL